ncbi:MAG: hypothetical protein H7Z43_07590 [Clostridia bacterium]|nr:hypothetical protein [Deltaproteobacteria bacterium]
MSKDDDALGESTEARPRPRLVKSIGSDETPTSDQLDDLTFKPSFKSKYQRMLPIIGAMLVVLALGPTISRVIDAYRAVVLDVQSDRMFIQETARSPKWVSAIAVKPGDMLVKESFGWNPAVVSAEPRDAPLVELASRYQASYDGTIIEMRAPNSPGRATVAVVDTTDGRKLEVPLWADHLATASVGRVLHKDPGGWDPYLQPIGAKLPPAPSANPVPAH